jgi:hypothetical protein
MRASGRAALLLVVAVAVALAVAGIPPALDEDRSVPGFCSPDCPLQQDTHSVAIAPAPLRYARSGEPAREQPRTATASARLATPASPDAPRAPPHA